MKNKIYKLTKEELEYELNININKELPINEASNIKEVMYRELLYQEIHKRGYKIRQYRIIVLKEPENCYDKKNNV